jgi:hypothetical protein
MEQRGLNHVKCQTALQASAARASAKQPCEHRAPRHAILHSHGRLQCVDLRDISRSEVKLDRAFGLKPGDPVSVELLSRRTLDGRVAWSVAAFCGIEFDQPLAESDPALTGV